MPKPNSLFSWLVYTTPYIPQSPLKGAPIPRLIVTRGVFMYHATLMDIFTTKIVRYGLVPFREKVKSIRKMTGMPKALYLEVSLEGSREWAKVFAYTHVEWRPEVFRSRVDPNGKINIDMAIIKVKVPRGTIFTPDPSVLGFDAFATERSFPPDLISLEEKITFNIDVNDVEDVWEEVENGIWD